MQKREHENIFHKKNIVKRITKKELAAPYFSACKLNLQVISTVCYILQENFKCYKNKLKNVDFEPS